jgi:hypothetical protein
VKEDTTNMLSLKFIIIDSCLRTLVSTHYQRNSANHKHALATRITPKGIHVTTFAGCTVTGIASSEPNRQLTCLAEAKHNAYQVTNP